VEDGVGSWTSGTRKRVGHCEEQGGIYLRQMPNNTVQSRSQPNLRFIKEKWESVESVTRLPTRDQPPLETGSK
jgi:hypothetical protein